MCSEKEENQREGQGPQAYLWDTNMRFRFKWNNPGEDRITSVVGIPAQSAVWWVTGISASARWWEAVLGDDGPAPKASLAITGNHPHPGQPRLQASAVLESKGIAGLGLGLETFRHLLEVWKEASVILIFVLSTWRGMQIG